MLLGKSMENYDQDRSIKLRNEVFQKYNVEEHEHLPSFGMKIVLGENRRMIDFIDFMTTNNFFKKRDLQKKRFKSHYPNTVIHPIHNLN